MCGSMKPKNVKNSPVMKKRCPTCPFKHEHEGQIEVANMVRHRCMTEASQICHHPALHGKEQTKLCRGARDYQLEMFHKMGFIEEPTDAAWAAKRKELGM